MTARSHILVVQGGGHAGEIESRLRQLDLEVHTAPSLEKAPEVLRLAGSVVSAVLVPVEAAEDGIKAGIKEIRRAGPATGLTFLAYGGAPDRSARKKLRSGGVMLALWVPFDDGTLRFQVNRAITADRDEHGRGRRRAPTFLFARVKAGAREKDAIVYSLSETGAFLETPRASMDGAQLDVEVRLPGESMLSSAEVLYSNVPGNLQRPNLPLGMGVRFTSLTTENRKRLAAYVEQRLAQLEI